jgi:hypothetical protein
MRAGRAGCKHWPTMSCLVNKKIQSVKITGVRMDGHDMVEGAGISRVFSRSEAGRTAVSAQRRWT